MLAMEFRVTDERGSYLCMAHGLIFEAIILAYDPTRDEAEWVPTRRVANDYSWAEERMVGALANFVPHAPKEVDHIAGLGSHRLLAWTDKSSSDDEHEQTQEDDEHEQTQEEDDEHEQMQEEDDELIPPPLLEDNEREEMEGQWE